MSPRDVPGKSKKLEPTLDVAPDAAELPVTVHDEGSPGAAAVVFAIAGVLEALGLAALVLYGVKGFEPGVPLAVAGLGLGTMLALIGMHVRLRLQHTEFATEGVTRRWRGLFGAGEWTEPLSAYRGVLRRSVHHSGSQYSAAYTEYIVMLKHAESKKRDVQLYNARYREGWRRKHEHYARLVGLTALIEADGEVQERAVEDLDKSVRQRVAEGSLTVEFDPNTPPPGDGLGVAVEGDALRLWTRRGGLGRVGLIVAVVLAVVGAAFVAVGFIGKLGGAAFVFPVLGVVLLLVGVGFLLVGRRIVQELHVSPSEVRAHWRTPLGDLGAKAVPADLIEEVVVRTPGGGSGFKTVQAVSDVVVVEFGMGLSQPEREWARDCIIAVISREG